MRTPFGCNSQRSIVLTFSLAILLFSFSTVIETVYLPIHLEKVIGLPRTQIGFLISIYAVTLVLLVAPFGHLSDRISPKRIIQAGLLLFAVYCSVVARAKSLFPLVLAQLLGGIGSSLVVIALPSLYFKHLTPSRRGQKVGFYIFANFFGFAFGPLTSGFLIKQWSVSYADVFLIVGGLMGGLLLFSFALKDTAPFKISLFEYKKDLLRKEVFLLICMLLAMGIHYGNEQVSFPLYMRDVIKLDDFDVGVVYAILGFWIALLSAIAGALYDRNKKVLLFVCLGLLVSGTAHMWTAFTKSYGAILVARIFHTTGDAFVIFSMNAIIASIFPAHRMGGNVGFTSFFQRQGSFLGALLSGYLDAYHGYRLSFIVAGSATILMGMILAANWRTMLKLSKQL